MNIAIYCRVGNKEQLDGLEDKRKQVEKFCNGIGLEVSEVAIVDEPKKDVEKVKPSFRL